MRLTDAHHESLPFTLPGTVGDQDWERILDTAHPQAEPGAFKPEDVYPLEARSLAVLRVPAAVPTPTVYPEVQTDV